MSEDIQEQLTPEELQLEDDVLNAIQGDGTFQLDITIGDKKRNTDRELSLKLRWPSMADEQAIARLTAKYCDGLPPELVTDADYEVARARAVIEVLAEGPFEDAEWLPHGDEKVMHQGKKVYRPDTGKVKSRAILVGFGRKYYEVYTRFQHLAA